MTPLKQTLSQLKRLQRNLSKDKARREFDAAQAAAKRLKEIFKRDRFKYDEGTEDYIIRAVMEALRK